MTPLAELLAENWDDRIPHVLEVLIENPQVVLDFLTANGKLRQIGGASPGCGHSQLVPLGATVYVLEEKPKNPADQLQAVKDIQEMFADEPA